MHYFEMKKNYLTPLGASILALWRSTPHCFFDKSNTDCAPNQNFGGLVHVAAAPPCIHLIAIHCVAVKQCGLIKKK